MKNHCVALLIVFLGGLVFCSCDKYNSSINGIISYVDSEDGMVYPADYALVNKMIVDGDNLQLMASVRTDAQGKYAFDHTSKGKWKLQATFTQDSLIYTGISEEFSTSGLKNINQNLTLTLLKTDENSQE